MASGTGECHNDPDSETLPGHSCVLKTWAYILEFNETRDPPPEEEYKFDLSELIQTNGLKPCGLNGTHQSNALRQIGRIDFGQSGIKERNSQKFSFSLTNPLNGLINEVHL
jgi:hypothetical protein